MQAVAVQLDIVWEDKPANHAKIRDLLAGVALEPDALVVLPEMFDTGFSMNVDVVAERDDELSQSFLSSLARDLNVTVVGGVVRRDAGGMGLNESVAYGPTGDELARYVKLQPFTLGKEHEHYLPGETPVSFAWRGCTVAPFICYDLRFPEVFRPTARAGAEVITVIANWPSPRVEHWVTLLRARAIENQAFVVGVNRCGVDPTLDYPGRSLIVDPHGQVLTDAGDAECVISADLDFDASREYRSWFTVLDDIRDDLVSPTLQRPAQAPR